MRVITAHLPKAGRPAFVEIGGNNTDAFRRPLSALVASYTAIEPNTSCGSDAASLDSLPPHSVDLLAAYFVLEHVADPRRFLALCAKAMRPDGVLILEVPNLYGYPADPAGFHWFEHTSHFSPNSLIAVAAKEGLEPVSVSLLNCSRPFGFVAVFRPGAGKPTAGISEYHVAKGCMTDSKAVVDAYRARLDAVRTRINSVRGTGAPVVVWAANQVTRDLLSGMAEDAGVVVVDSNPAKKAYFHPIPVREPAEAKEAIRSAGLVVISTALHAEAITRHIRTAVGKAEQPGDIVIIRAV